MNKDIWEDNFRPYFANLGYSTHVMSFSATGASASVRSKATFEDYVNECKHQIELCDTPPIVISHSMGGLIALHAATQTNIHALVALSPAPIQGMGKSLSTLAVNFVFSTSFTPLHFVEMLFSQSANAKRLCRQTMFSKTCDKQKVERTIESMQPEAQNVLSALVNPPGLDFRKVDEERIFFISATGDKIVQAEEVKRSASIIECECHAYKGYSHMFQVESDWKKIADDIQAWLSAIDETKPDEATTHYDWMNPFNLIWSAWKK